MIVQAVPHLTPISKLTEARAYLQGMSESTREEEEQLLARIKAIGVDLWLDDDSSIMLRAVEPGFRDPVELNASEARVIARGLECLAARLDADG